jgi:hypothetical protein
MQLRSDLNNLAQVNKVGNVEPAPRADGMADPRQEAFSRSMAGLLGKSLLAQVLSRMGDGSFLVKVEGTPVRMMLPAGAQVGSEVPLTMVSASPRPTFQISNGDGRALPATLYVPGSPLAALTDPAIAYDAKAGPVLPGQASQTGAAALSQAAALAAASALADGTPDPASPHAPPAPVLSDAARLISSVLSAAGKASGNAGAVHGTEPLMASPRPDPAELAGKLAATVSESGLFYESHLAEWANGNRALSTLMVEPQAAKAPGVPPTEPQTAQLINLQLTSQEQARVMWQGQLLPGQQMAWEINRDAPEQRGGADGEAPEPAWRSGMRFRLPLLGDIDATVVMRGSQCQVEIKAGSAGIGELLRAHAARLTAAMEAAGTPLTSLSIGVLPQATQDD